MNFLPRSSFFNGSFDLFDHSSNTENNGMLKADIYEKDNEYHIEVDIPGVKKEDIALDYDNGYITVHASKQSQGNEEDNYIRRERFYGEYSRSFYVGDIHEDSIKASYDHGSLSIVFPKEEAPRETKRQINID